MSNRKIDDMKRKNRHPWKDIEKLSKKKPKEEYINGWKHRDIKEPNDFCCKLPNPANDEFQSLIELFELLLSDEIFDHVCRKTNKYVSLKGNHALNLHKQELRSFIAVLTLSGYIDLPHSSMYWEMTEVIIASLSHYLQETVTMKFWRICTYLLMITSTTVASLQRCVH